MTAAEKMTPSPAELLNVAPDTIEADPENPRTVFDDKTQAELVQSVKDVGVKVPVLVRPVPQKGAVKYRLVSGERRWRAARSAKVATIPALVETLTDEQAYERAQLENSDRDNLQPLEEGFGWKHWMEKYGLSADQVGAKVGKSRESVYARIKLTELKGSALKYLQQGTINASLALLIARRGDEASQERAISVLHDACDEMGFAVLDDMPFREAEAALKEDERQAKAKLDAEKATVEIAEKALEKGFEVMLPEESEKALSYGGGFVELNKPNHYDPKQRTWDKLLGDKVVPIIAIDAQGKPHKVVPEKELLKVAAELGVKTTYGGGQSSKHENEQKQREAATKKRRVIARAAMELLVAKAAKNDGVAFLRMVAQLAVAKASAEAKKEMVRRRGLLDEAKVKAPQAGHGDAQTALTVAAAKMDKGECIALILECLVSDGAAGWAWSPGFGDAFKEATSFFGIDLKKVEADVKDEEKEAEKLAATAEKKAAAKKPGDCVVVSCKGGADCEKHNAGKAAPKASAKKGKK